MAIKKMNPQKKKIRASSTKSIQVVPAKRTDSSAALADGRSGLKEQSMQHFPIVGIGASAGGLAAIKAFFSGMPAIIDTNMAFVLVQHLAPDHKSILTGLIQRSTRMQVSEVEDGMKVLPNCAYIIPPGRDMAFLEGSLRLFEPAAPRGQRLPIDFFFKSLAKDQQEKAICIILSGNGSDGNLGLRAIKDVGGMAMAQSPHSTEYDAMPKNAIATGLVDYKLPPAEMPLQLMAYMAHGFVESSKPSPVSQAMTENHRKTILNELLDETGHDFSQYKPDSVNCRIERRMAAHELEMIDEYVKYLQEDPAEKKALLGELLIGVTNFFRDPEIFKALEKKIIPQLFAKRPADDVVRVWSQGCSTGEEAYSLAILLMEHMNTLEQNYRVQIFATDIDSSAITTARAGLYPASIAVDISPERLARYFSVEPDGNTYRIHKSIRDMVIFSEQNVIKDPPFSKLDLISSRNVLMYMNAHLQRKIIPTFHYALKPNGFLFLGSPESIEDCSDMFAELDSTAKFYRRRQGARNVLPDSLNRTPATMTMENGTQPQSFRKRLGSGKLSLRELTERTLLNQVSPTGALVNGDGDILYLHGRTGMYLQPVPGEVTVNNILNMAREGLKHELTSALHKATTSKKTLRSTGLHVNSNGAFITVNLSVSPVVTGPAATSEEPLYLVILEEVAQMRSNKSVNAGESDISPELDTGVYIASLKQELRAKKEDLQNANEELKSSNEQMQSITEEMQATNEELETSKEELQSVNEELVTVNAEMQINLTDLTRANNDMSNMVAGTGIGTIFVDYGLCILRFTPEAAKIINLIKTDVGRPVGHIVSNLVNYNSLVADVNAVLETLLPKDVDVQTIDEKWYTMRIHPYRTIDNVIEGAVITFADITDRKGAEDSLKKMMIKSKP